MTDAEMVKAMEICKDKEIPCDDCPLVECGDCEGISRQYFYDRFKQLQSENDALRERLERAVELPCKLGDTIYKVYNKCDGHNCPFNGYYGKWRCHYEGERRCGPFISTEHFCYDHIPFINKTVFTSKEAAEALLVELKGKER